MNKLSLNLCKVKIKALKNMYNVFKETRETERISASERINDAKIAVMYESEIEAYEKMYSYLNGEINKKEFLED